MHSLRVLYSFPHSLGAPGIGTTAYHQVQALAEAGHRVTVWSRSVQRLPDAVSVHRTWSLAGRRLPTRAVGYDRVLAWHDAATARALGPRRSAFDVVHVWPSSARATARAARAAGVPCVREVPNTHTRAALRAVERERARLGLPTLPDAVRAADARRADREDEEMALVDALLAPSEVVRESLLAAAVPSARVLRHRYGYDPSAFPAPAEPARAAGRALTAAFVGRCDPRKGLHHALAAWHRSGAAQHGRLLVAGAFADRDYRRMLQPLLDHPSVEVRGFSADPAEVYRDADVLVLPSVEEGSALVTYEAQAMGCALLVSDASGAVVEDGVQGLVHRAGDVDALTAHLRAVLTRPGLLDGLRAGALAQAPGLTWSAAGAALAEAYLQTTCAVDAPAHQEDAS